MQAATQTPSTGLRHLKVPESDARSIAFRHLPPNSARTGYAIYLRAAVHRHVQRFPKVLGIKTNKTMEAT